MNNHIDFEMNNLGLNQFMDTEQQWRNNDSYELYAVCIHIGENMGQGHYTSKQLFDVVFYVFLLNF